MTEVELAVLKSAGIDFGRSREGWSQEKLIEHVQGLAQQLAIEDKSEDD
jgi:hypothetical protein